MQTSIRRATIADWRAVRSVRLTALQESPDAFGSTYARERDFAQEDWERRLKGPGVTFLAVAADRPDEPVGLSGGFPDGDTIELVSMWVAPSHRGTGVASLLVSAVVDWAGESGAPATHLWVTESNQPARRFYERCGFTYLDDRQPLPSNPDLDELRMVRNGNQ